MPRVFHLPDDLCRISVGLRDGFLFSFLYSQGFFEIRQEDVSISYLPLAHMFERMIQVNSESTPQPTPRLELLNEEVKGHNKGLE